MLNLDDAFVVISTLTSSVLLMLATSLVLDPTNAHGKDIRRSARWIRLTQACLVISEGIYHLHAMRTNPLILSHRFYAGWTKLLSGTALAVSAVVALVPWATILHKV